jgi:probable phosphoglycerate mutase
LAVTETTDDLAEWNYGKYEGITTPTIHETDPDWWLWRDGAPDGESPGEVAARLDRVLAHARTFLDRGDVALIAHGHSLRAAGARWLGLPVEYGGRLRLGTATISTLSFEHGREAIGTWNA